ncbi:hypothetical protein C2E23DRAFT_101476 [Lenzites betulinus]|nr:hypothetical protein C2E23DRAFT_101476 [Lenzites betulinus]
MTPWPSCPPSNARYAPLFNQQKQDPCTITEKLLSTCHGTIDPNNFTPLTNNQCTCSTVFYSLAYVCGECGNSEVFDQSWNMYIGKIGCGKPDMQSYEEKFDPDRTSIPAWAYLRLDNDGTVNIENALAVAGEHLQDMTTTGSTASDSVPTKSPSPGSPQEAPVFSGVTSTGTSPSTSDSSGTAAQHAAPAGSDMAPSSDGPVYDTSGVRPNGPSVPTNSAHPPNVPATGNAAEAAAAHRSNHLGAILGAVLGAIAAVLVLAFVICLVRRRRRAKKAIIASGSLEWWRRSSANRPPGLTSVERSDSSTIGQEDTEYDESETLHGTLAEKKSVMYGEYPDL